MAYISKERFTRIRKELLAAGWKPVTISVLGIDEEKFINPRTGRKCALLAAEISEQTHRAKKRKR